MIDFSSEQGQRTINAIARLEGAPDFEIVKEWLNAMLVNIGIDWIDLRGEETLIAQGYGEALRDITVPLNYPRKVIESINSQSERKAAGGRIRTYT
jgi:hypothetical protein